VLKIEGEFPHFTISTNKNTYETRTIVVGIGVSNTFAIDGLLPFVQPHAKSLPENNAYKLKILTIK
jgi:hypothetical protein